MTETAITKDMLPEGHDEMLSQIFLSGNLANLTQKQKWEYTASICQRIGVDPYTRPFRLLYNKRTQEEVLYATASCTDQLIRLHNISFKLSDPIIDEKRATVMFSCTAILPSGRNGNDFALIPLDYYSAPKTLEWLRGEDYCNAIMKCATKAVRRTVLKVVGLGIMSESDAEPMLRNSEEYEPRNIIDAELHERGNLLNGDQRKKVLEWFRAAVQTGVWKDYGSPEEAAHACFGDIAFFTNETNPEAHKEAIHQATIEACEIFQLEINEKERKAEADIKKKSQKTSASGSDAAKKNIDAQDISTVAQTPGQENDSSGQADAIANARAITPQIKELTSGKKHREPLNKKAAEKLASALEYIPQARKEREKPDWEQDRQPLKEICGAGKWDKDRIQHALKFKFRHHDASIDKLTWEKYEDMCRFFATVDPAAYEMEDN